MKVIIVAILLFFTNSLNAKMPNQNTVFIVSGFIYDEYNIPLSNALVEIYDKDIRQDKMLGRVNTDAKGFYSFRFIGQAADPEYKGPDVFLKVYPSGIQNMHVKSKIWFNVKEFTTIDFKIDNTELKPLNEFDLLSDSLSGPVPPQYMNEIWETFTDDDVNFIAGESYLTETSVRALLSSFKFAKITNRNLRLSQFKNIPNKLLAAFFYGLLSEGIPNNIEKIESMQKETIRSTIKRAVDKNIISGRILLSL